MPGTVPVYAFAGVAVASTLIQPELVRAPLAARPHYRVSVTPFPLPDANAVHHDWLDAAGRVTLRVWRQDRTSLLRIPGLANASLHDGGDVRLWCDAGIDEVALRHALIDQFLPRFLAGDGMLMLHAAGVVDPGARALLLLGETGYGKSTLTAAFVQAGASLLNDDCLRVAADTGSVRAIPSYPGMRLRPDSLSALYGDDLPETSPVAEYMDKRRVAVPAQDGAVAVAQDPSALVGTEVGTIVVLQPPRSADTAISVEPMAASDACMAIVENSFALDPTDMTWVHAQLARAAAVADAVPVYRLGYPRDYARLPEVIARLRELLL